MAKNHPLIKDVKNWILDSFSFMDAVGYDILFDDDIYGMENTKAISADIDGLTDFDFEKGKKNLLNSIPNKIKAEFPYLRITSGKDGDYFIMFIVLLDNNDYLEDKNIQYINLNESKESARKSMKESINGDCYIYYDDDDGKRNVFCDYVKGITDTRSWFYLNEYIIDAIHIFKNEKQAQKFIDEHLKYFADQDKVVIAEYPQTFSGFFESKKSARKSIKESSDVTDKIASEIDKSYWIDKLIDDLDRHYESMEKAWLKNLDKLSDEDILGIVDDCMGKSKTLVGKSEMLKNKMIDDLSKAYDDYIDDIDRQIRIGKSEDEIKKMIENTLENDIKMYLKLAYNNKASSNYFMVKFAEDNLI